jgi:hypothetical protein
MRSFLQDRDLYRGAQLRHHLLLILIACLAIPLTAQAETSIAVWTKECLIPAGLFLKGSEALTSLSGRFAREVSVLAFVITTLLFLANFLFSRLRERGLTQRPAGTSVAAASFWLPASVLLGGVAAICGWAFVALLALAVKLFGSASFQSFMPDAAMFVLVGTLLLAALIQFVYELYFGWAPHRGKLKGQAYKQKVQEIFRRIAVTVGIPLIIIGFISAIAFTATSITYKDLSVWQILSIILFPAIVSFAAAVSVYLLLMFFAWLIKGDILIIFLIILFVSIFWLYRIGSFVFRWVGGREVERHPRVAAFTPLRPDWYSMQNLGMQDPYKLQSYRDRKLLWIPVFFILIGMMFLLEWPLVGALMLVAGAISTLYYWIKL